MTSRAALKPNEQALFDRIKPMGLKPFGGYTTEQILAHLVRTYSSNLSQFNDAIAMWASESLNIDIPVWEEVNSKTTKRTERTYTARRGNSGRGRGGHGGRGGIQHRDIKKTTHHPLKDANQPTTEQTKQQAPTKPQATGAYAAALKAGSKANGVTKPVQQKPRAEPQEKAVTHTQTEKPVTEKPVTEKTQTKKTASKPATARGAWAQKSLQETWQEKEQTVKAPQPETVPVQAPVSAKPATKSGKRASNKNKKSSKANRAAAAEHTTETKPEVENAEERSAEPIQEVEPVIEKTEVIVEEQVVIPENVPVEVAETQVEDIAEQQKLRFGAAEPSTGFTFGIVEEAPSTSQPVPVGPRMNLGTAQTYKTSNFQFGAVGEAPTADTVETVTESVSSMAVDNSDNRGAPPGLDEEVQPRQASEIEAEHIARAQAEAEKHAREQAQQEAAVGAPEEQQQQHFHSFPQPGAYQQQYHPSQFQFNPASQPQVEMRRMQNRYDQAGRGRGGKSRNSGRTDRRGGANKMGNARNEGAYNPSNMSMAPPGMDSNYNYPMNVAPMPGGMPDFQNMPFNVPVNFPGVHHHDFMYSPHTHMYAQPNSMQSSSSVGGSHESSHDPSASAAMIPPGMEPQSYSFSQAGSAQAPATTQAQQNMAMPGFNQYTNFNPYSNFPYNFAAGSMGMNPSMYYGVPQQQQQQANAPGNQQFHGRVPNSFGGAQHSPVPQAGNKLSQPAPMPMSSGLGGSFGLTGSSTPQNNNQFLNNQRQSPSDYPFEQPGNTGSFGQSAPYFAEFNNSQHAWGSA